MDGGAAHWDEVYASRAADELSWFQAEPVVSFRLLHDFAPPPASVVDIGVGESRLIEQILERGWRDVTVLDISAEALLELRIRLGVHGRGLSWVNADVTDWVPERFFTAWHDRAVFHFLVDESDRAAYVETAREAIAAGGVAIIGTFASDGPESCSGLPVQRYDVGGLVEAFGADFQLLHAEREEHRTPSGSAQAFCWVVLRRRATWDESEAS